MGWIVFYVFATAVICYLLGCFNGAIVVSKYILRNDIRNHGSGNAGLTNFHRVFGGGLTFVVILSDVLKGVAAVYVGAALFDMGIHDPILGKYFAALFAVLGHMFPCMFGFKGGKGILTAGTIAIALDWRLAAAVWGIFIVMTVLTRWVSLGSICAGALFPIMTWFIYQNPLYTALGAICGGLIVWKHHANIGRLLRGEESKFSFHRKDASKEEPK